MFKPVQSYAGEFVYKYRTCERLDWLEQCLLKRTLYFPMIPELNDPEEARPRLFAPSQDSIIQTLRFWSPNFDRDTWPLVEGLKKRALLDMVGPLLYQLFADHRVYSASRRADNGHLWKHYADNHSGYCIEFRTKQLAESIRELHVSSLNTFIEVQYARDIRLEITELAKLNLNFLARKKSGWANEEEVRLIATKGSKALQPFNGSALSRIILGSSISVEHEREIREMAARRRPSLLVISERELVI